MAQHEVRFDVPFRPLGNADVRFIVDADGSKLGELHVSRGAVAWLGKDKSFGRRLTWERLADLFEREGTKRKP